VSAATGSTEEGGCLCGAVRYRIEGPIAPGVHCHCSLCRRSTGATVVTWITVARTAFRLLCGSPQVYRSSAVAERSFCGRCGTQLTFRHDEAPEAIDVTVASLDAPGRHPPDHHIFAADRLPWLRLDEQLIAYQGETPPQHRRGDT